ncbi:uncharacterized protein MAM_06524 [Metarhizium album ARSEF 1941]|uniref:WW domain-containing protein n=1 Tax=Metarhizium album (strain ARSEF 1941) TaxID=1081103 RepID=A0A0B2WNV6_METAS|nr:uncharacterized protein MAM_06524 [Metarhizium album ARSEF 1941]KHN95683.1 hypothetical protein MAM_06524 [Metarhizium album ARSEF 1941]
MVGLPLGWDSDYDGRRWFYKYRPTGHIQYHFPSEGDEFPEFVDADAPAPALAPEELLESQQQVKRKTSSARCGADAASKRASTKVADNGHVHKYAMSATAKPISVVWEGDDDAEGDGMFQPENFMFLGPGTYVDMSPLAEEEEEAAKRSVEGAVSEGFLDSGASTGTTAVARAKGVSPPGSSNTTPMMAKSEPSASPGQTDAQIKGATAIESMSVASSPRVVESEPVPTRPPFEIGSTVVTAQIPDSSVVHMMDGREMPVEMMGDTIHRFDPVGFVAEMPTEQTATARFKLPPDPVEIADKTVLAPAETAATALLELELAELPVPSTPSRSKEVPIVSSPKESGEKQQSAGGDGITKKDATGPVQQAPSDRLQSYEVTSRAEPSPPLVQCTGPPYANEGPSHGCGQHGPHSVQYGQAEISNPVKSETFKIARKQLGGAPSMPAAPQTQKLGYQAYVPGPATTAIPLPKLLKRKSIGLQREASLMLSMKGNSVNMDPNAVPRVLSPPQHALPNAFIQSDVAEQARSTEENRTEKFNFSLTHTPSILKPARKRNSVQDMCPQQQLPTPAAVATLAQPQSPRSIAVSKLPSVLRPARERSSSQPGQRISGAGQQLDKSQPVQQINLQPVWATQVVQSSRPASVMSIINHAPYGSQYSGVDLGPIPRRHNLTQPSSSECTLPELRSQPLPPRNMHESVIIQPPQPQAISRTVQPMSQQPPKCQFQVPSSNWQDIAERQLVSPQSAIGTIQHSSLFKPSKTVVTPVLSQPGQGERNHPVTRRDSMFTPGEVSPTRPRQDSQVSALESPLPPDAARRDSPNPTTSDRNYTPPPLTDTTGPLASGWTQSTVPNPQNGNPPVPSKIREHAGGSFSAVQSSPDRPLSQDRQLTIDVPEQQQQKTAARLEPQFRSAQQTEQQEPPQPSPPANRQGEEKKLPEEPMQAIGHPIGYQVKGLANLHDHCLAGKQTVPAPRSGYIPGRIGEHIDSERGSKFEETHQITRPSSVVSSIQDSLPETPVSPSGPTLQQPKPSAPNQVEGQVPTMGQPSMLSTQKGQTLNDQPGISKKSQGIMPLGHMQAQMRTQTAPGQMMSTPNSLAGQVPSGQGHCGRAHLFKMPGKPLVQGSTLLQPQFQRQNQTRKARQASSDPDQPQVVHSEICSTASVVSTAQQGVTPRQVQVSAGYRDSNPSEHDVTPGPLFAPSNRSRGGNSEMQPPGANQAADNSKWTERPAADYSGGDWGDEEDWDRR